MKRQIGSDLVLTHFHLDLPLHVASDASPYGLGAVLSHSMPDGTERPIAFASRTLNTAEQNYSQIDKEALGIVWSLKKFHTYLYGRRFTLITAHQPLTAIFSPVKNLPSMTATRLQRYALLLAGYQYDIVYRKTSDHGNADGLSRLPINSPTSEADADGGAVDTFHVSQFDPLPVTAEQVFRETRRDPTFAAVYQAVQTGDFSACTDHQPYYHRRSELISHQGCLLWVHASSFHPACNGMSWTSFTVRTAALCARRNSLAAMCGGRRLTTTSTPVSPRAVTASSIVTSLPKRRCIHGNGLLAHGS